MKPGRYAVFAALGLALASCGDDAADVEPSGDGLTATGEVLEPTVSDAMIPTDQLRSSPPLLRTQPASGVPVDGGEAGDAEVSVEGDAEGEAEPATVPVLQPESDPDEPAQ
jgi:hypothetical protein